MKSLVDLLEHLLQDCGRKCGVSVRRDVETLRTRVKHEGDSLLTIALPNFCRDFERCLDGGRMVPGLFASFGKLKSGVPEFLQGFLHHVFGLDGCLLASPSIACIQCVRQICLFAKKIERPCSEERVVDAVAAYRKCEDEVVGTLPTGKLTRYFRLVAALLCRSLNLDDPSIYSDLLVPKHGPGATCERVLGNQKWRFRRWTTRLEEVGFTYFRWGRASKWIGLEDLDDWPELVEPEDELPVRVVFVPKTLKSPRVIAVEPVCMQYAQQALSNLLVRSIERGPNNGFGNMVHHSFAHGHINFSDQAKNQELALQGSKGGRQATLDLSEASDRVSVSHVDALLASVPVFRSFARAARSTRAQLPGGDILTLRKFASMGSALTFPLESMVFYCTIVASRCVRAGVFPTARNVRTLGQDVYVYGDDLVVPADEASAICEDLETMGFRVNRNKSFWNGKFRESCGVDAYDGVQVTPVYLRRDLPASRADVSGILSTVSTCNQLDESGYTNTATALRKAVECVTGKLPATSKGGPVLGWTNGYSEAKVRQRWNKRLQRVEFLALVPFSPDAADPIDGDAALAKCFRVMRGRQPVHELLPSVEESSVDPEHLERSVTPYGVALTRRWVPSL